MSAHPLCRCWRAKGRPRVLRSRIHERPGRKGRALDRETAMAAFKAAWKKSLSILVSVPGFAPETYRILTSFG